MPTFTKGVLRDFPRVNVTRGYAGNEPQAITKSAPVNSSATIKSGQAIALVAGEWVQADETHSSSQIYIAFHDSTDTDVVSCSKLLGFAVLGEFEIETPWINVDGLSVGDKLVVNASNDICELGNDNGGTAGTAVIGYVSEIRDLGVRGHTNSNARGGVLGTVPEDSTSNGAYELKITVTDSPTDASTIILDDCEGNTVTYAINHSDDVTAARAIGVATAIAANTLLAGSGNDAIAAQIAASIAASSDPFQATSVGPEVFIVQTAAGSGRSTVGAGTLDNALVGTEFNTGPANYVVKFVTSA